MCQGLQIFRAMEHPCLPILYIDQDNPKKLTNLKRTVNYQLSMHYGFRNICIYYWKILKTLSLRMSDQFIQLQEQNVPPPQPPVVMEWSMLYIPANTRCGADQPSPGHTYQLNREIYAQKL